MSVTNMHPASELSAARELRSVMQGRVVMARSTGNGRRICRKASPHSRCWAAAPTSLYHVIENRFVMPMAATAPGWDP